MAVRDRFLRRYALLMVLLIRKETIHMNPGKIAQPLIHKYSRFRAQLLIIQLFTPETTPYQVPKTNREAQPGKFKQGRNLALLTIYHGLDILRALWCLKCIQNVHNTSNVQCY